MGKREDKAFFSKEAKTLSNLGWREYSTGSSGEKTFGFGSWNQFKKDRVDGNTTNGGSTPWKNALLIFVKIPLRTRVNGNVRQICKAFYDRKKRSYVVLKNETGKLRFFDGQNNTDIAASDVSDVVEWIEKDLAGIATVRKFRTGIQYFPMQKVFYGAPGTGKSYKINRLAGRAARESSFKTFMAGSPQIKQSSEGDYISYYKNLYEAKRVCLFDYDCVIDEESKKKYNAQDPHWGTVITAYNKFLEQQSSLSLKGNVLRTTFHPDYDYAQFIGCYKPQMIGEKVRYSFIPQIFARAYTLAWRLYLNCNEESSCESQVYLVIEEINRGNCAQIFGDIFQLLDREENGFSKYSIDADYDFATWLQKESCLKDAVVWKKYLSCVKMFSQSIGESGRVMLSLPPNLNILASMNTSDQSLFPMDSAFKRRFDWEYVPIRYRKNEVPIEEQTSWNADKLEIELYPRGYEPIEHETLYENPRWTVFLEKINKDIREKTFSEDKQMGEFFVKAQDVGDRKIIDFNTFRSKVLFYLWDSVYKDYLDSKSFFNPEDDEAKVIYFQDLFKNDDEAARTIIRMIQYLDKDKDGNELNEILIKR